MANYEFKLPDIGEGIAEAEIVAWHVKLGDTVTEDQQIADMMTDKATVEMESPVAGKVVQLAGEVGDQIAIGSVLVVIETEGEAHPHEHPPKIIESHEEVPLADGAVEPTAKQEAAIPTTAVEEQTEPVRAERRAEPEVEVRPSTSLGTSGLLCSLADRHRWNRFRLLRRRRLGAICQRLLQLACSGGLLGRSCPALGLDLDQHRSDRDLVANFSGQLLDRPGDRRFHFDRRLVGHHVGKLLVLLDPVADLDVPGDDFGLGNAFADVGQLELIDAHASRTFFSAFFMRIGPGK